MATGSTSFPHRTPEPSHWQVLRFSALAVPLYASAQPVLAYVPAILSRHHGIDLASLGFVFLAGQIINALLDPVIGTLSDRTTSRLGRRRPWVAGGGMLFLLGAAMLFFPPPDVSLTWVVLGVFTYFTGFSIAKTPLLAWSGEISGDYGQRTAIASYFSLLSSVALVLALILPALADWLRPGDDVLRLGLFGVLVLVTGIPGLWLSLTTLPDDPIPARPYRMGLGHSLAEGVRAVTRNPLLLRVLAADTVVMAGQCMRTSLLVFVVSFIFRRPDLAAALFLFQYSVGLLSAPIWQRIGRRLGKSRAAILAELLQTAINLGLLGLAPDRLGLLVALAAAQGLTQGAGNLMLRAMVADIADAEQLTSGEQRNGLFFSAFSISEKLGSAFALGIALPLLGWLGFNPHGANSPAALDALLLVFALGPALGHGIAAGLLARFPLDETAHREIRARLDAREGAAWPAE